MKSTIHRRACLSLGCIFIIYIYRWSIDYSRERKCILLKSRGKSSDRLLSFKKAWKCFWGRRMPCIRLLGIREKIQIALDLFRVGWTYVLLPFAMIRALDRVIRVRNIWNLFKATARNIDLLTYVLLQPAAILNDTGTLMRTYSKPLQGILISISCQVLARKFYDCWYCGFSNMSSNGICSHYLFIRRCPPVYQVLGFSF